MSVVREERAHVARERVAVMRPGREPCCHAGSLAATASSAGDDLAREGRKRLALTSAPVLDLRFDVVCTLMALHHIADTDGILEAFRRVLPSGGHLFIADLDAEDGSFHGAGFQGHNGFERPELGARLERSGFRDPRFETVFEVKKVTASGPRTFPVFLAAARRV